ncbi:hypothetical protein [Streptomyces sp. NPDC049915]|uniref:hypothetical protein n=1 Tax=Streptomyces sp. NPDC049915 TaxID=3155510 RepID=UPI0034478D3E
MSSQREDEIARGVARGMAEHYQRQADQQGRQLLSCALLFIIVGGGLIAYMCWKT